MTMSQTISKLNKAGLTYDSKYIYSQDGTVLAGFDGENIIGKYETVPLKDVEEMTTMPCLDVLQLSIKDTNGEIHVLTPKDVAHSTWCALSIQDNIKLSFDEFLDIYPLMFSEDMGRMNELEERLYIKMNGEYVAYSEKDHEAILMKMAESKLKELFPNRNLRYKDTTLFKVILSRLRSSKYNPIREWIEALPQWDGVDRIGTYFRDTLGASTICLDPEEDALYQKTVMEAWMVGLVARQYEEVSCEVYPCLIGSQEAGKSRAVKFLSPDINWYESVHTTVYDDRKFLEGVCKKVVVEFGEAKTLDTDQNVLKDFLSKSSDTYRAAYATDPESHPRHWCAIITTNDTTPLRDPTGARRFYPFFCNRANELKVFDTATIDKEEQALIKEHVKMMWAEAYAKYKMGWKCFIPKGLDIGQKEVQALATRYNYESEYINVRLDCHEEYCKPGARVKYFDLYSAVWPGCDGVPDKAQKSAITSWANDENCPWKSDIWNEKQPNGKYKTVRGYSRKQKGGEPQ